MFGAVRHRATTMPVAVKLLMASLATALLVRFDLDCVKECFFVVFKCSEVAADCITMLQPCYNACR